MTASRPHRPRSRSTIVRVVAALGSLATFARAGAARGADAGATTDDIAAQALFDAGRELVARGDFAAGCAKLAESQRMAPASGTAFNLANCLAHIGRLASAWSLFRDVEAESRLAGQRDRAQRARERASELEPVLPRLSVQVTPPAEGEELDVRRDGIAIGSAQWEIAVPVDFGDHVVTAAAPGRRAFRAVVHVDQERQLVTVTVPALELEIPPDTSEHEVAPPSPPSPPARPEIEVQQQRQPPPAPAPAPRGLRVPRRAAIVALVSGSGLLALGGATAAFAWERYHAAAPCDDVGCRTQQAVDQRKGARTLGDIATGLAIAGGAVAAAGVVLWFARDRDDGGRAAGARVTWRAGVQPNGVVVAGAW